MRWRLSAGLGLAAAALGAAALFQAPSPREVKEPGGEARDALREITDPGDGCHQLVSAVGYADALLVDLGQESFQDFDNATRSRLSQVSGTTRLEADDLPSDQVRAQAAVVSRLAHAASRTAQGEGERKARARTLVAYKAEAARLVLYCGDADGSR